MKNYRPNAHECYSDDRGSTTGRGGEEEAKEPLFATTSIPLSVTTAPTGPLSPSLKSKVLVDLSASPLLNYLKKGKRDAEFEVLLTAM
ncbi:hypothetical protein E2C01_063589 [Portunus trituberculatus]|uniref:Uncharacterized protein n=1 Tax=Portunus trituberculatus TaxID=210409 RepID=A0A5B7HHG5_PORTR|nr:hypothetical protein [Portunus trituberculatus]